MDLNLKGKKALVTGGTHGIGLCIAIELAKEGCDIALFSRTAGRVAETEKILDSLNCNNICMVADVLNKDSYNYIEHSIKDNWGGVDIVINNIGGGGRWGKPDMLDTDESVWKEVFDKNVTSARKYTKMFLPYMLKNKWAKAATIAVTFNVKEAKRAVTVVPIFAPNVNG